MSSLKFERIYSAPINKVWRAITDKKQMKEWYFDLEEFKPEPGFEFSFYGEKDGKKYLHKCRVVDVQPVNKLSYTWSYDGYPGSSLVTFELEELEAAKTKLTLTHSGLDSFPQDEPDFASDNFTMGWTFITGKSLMEFVETDYIRIKTMIKASAQTVWKILLEPDNKWANAFGEGTLTETTWQQGAPVIWTDVNGEVGARGIVKQRTEHKQLVLQYFDEPGVQPNETLGEYSEAFFISDQAGGFVELEAVSGPLSKKYMLSHTGMWQKALAMIKSGAEVQ